MQFRKQNKEINFATVLQALVQLITEYYLNSLYNFSSTSKTSK